MNLTTNILTNINTDIINANTISTKIRRYDFFKMSEFDLLIKTCPEQIKPNRLEIIKSLIYEAPYDYYITITFAYPFARERSRRYLNGFIQRFNRKVNGSNKNKSLSGYASEEYKKDINGEPRWHYHIILKRKDGCTKSQDIEIINIFNEIIKKETYADEQKIYHKLYNEKAVDITIPNGSIEDYFRIIKYMTKSMDCSDNYMDNISPVSKVGCCFGDVSKESNY